MVKRIGSAVVLLLAAATLSAQDLTQPGSFFDRYAGWQTLGYNSVHDEFLMVFPGSWNNGGATNVVGVRIDAASGGLLSPTPFRITDRISIPYGSAMAFAPDADRYFIVTRDIRYGDLYGILVNGDGSNPTLLYLADHGVDPYVMDPMTVAYDPVAQRFLAVWQDFQDSGIVGRRFTTAGAADGPAFMIEPINPDGPEVASVPVLTYLGGASKSFLLATMKTPAMYNGGDIPGIISVRAIGPGNFVGAPTAIAEPGAPGRVQFSASVAANRTSQEFLVAWQETDPDWGSNSDLYFRRVAPNGAPQGLGPVPLQIGAEQDGFPVVSWVDNDNLYAVAWQRTNPEWGTDIMAAKISGDVAGPGRLQGYDESQGDLRLAMATRAGHSETLLTWTGQEQSMRGTRFITALKPAAPVGVTQCMANGTPVAVRASVRGDAFIAKAKVSHPEDDSVRLEVEVRPTGTAFTNVPTAVGAQATSGTFASVRAEGLEVGRSYHWQARAVSSAGLASTWTSFGGNDDPGDPDFTVIANALPAVASLAQLNRAGGSALRPGASAADLPGLRFQAVVSDVDDDTCSLQVELRPLNGSESWITTAPAAIAGSTVDLDLAPPPGDYGWRCRAIDAMGGAGPWTDFEGEADLDFRVEASGSRGSRGACGNSAGGSTGWIGLALVLLLAGRIRV